MPNSCRRIRRIYHRIRGTLWLPVHPTSPRKPNALSIFLPMVVLRKLIPSIRSLSWKKFHGKTLDAKLAKDKRLGGVAHASPFKFSKHGQCGMEISELFPNVAKHADNLCVIRSMVTDVPNHEPGLMMMNCGEISRPVPCAGAWILYGLGSENQSLPVSLSFVRPGYPRLQLRIGEMLSCQGYIKVHSSIHNTPILSSSSQT